ncbi:MAG: xanthine dehydrogenase small subunit [Alphaproteobacteria bacterium]
MSTELQFFLAGEVLEVSEVDPTLTLLDYLRDHRALTGTKEGCNEGDCGACTVLLGNYEPLNERIVYRAVNACITLLPAVHRHWVVTVEDLSDGITNLHPVQDAMVKRHGSQCGFCTPGFVMSLAALHLDGAPADQAETYIAGNLCRCTGYGPILAAAKDSAGAPKDPVFGAKEAKAIDWFRSLPVDTGLFYERKHQTYDAPVSLKALLQARADNPDAVLVAGTTELGLWVNKDLQDFPNLISTTRVPEMTAVAFQPDGSLVIGGAATYEQAWPLLRQVIPEGQDWFERFASKQIRQQATIGGNIVNASPIGDGPPVFLALQASVELSSVSGSRVIPLSEFFVGYKKTALGADEVLTGIIIPPRQNEQSFAALKVSKRKDQDISAVMAAFSWRMENGHFHDVRIAFGGMSATPMLADFTNAALEGKPANAATMTAALAALDDDFSPIDDLRATAWYRMTVSQNLLEQALSAAIETAQEHAG